jgi:hypothetical protein
MFSRFFSSEHNRRASASFPPDCSTNTLPKEKIIPGGPSPDCSFPPHNTRHHIATSRVAADAGAHAQTSRTFENVVGPTEGQPEVDAVFTPTTSQRTCQPNLYPATTVAVDAKSALKNVGSRSASHSSRRLSDAHLENASIAAAASEVADEGRSASVASRRANRSKTMGNASGSAFANGAATAANEPPDVDQSLYARAASAEDELRPREQAAIRKEERMF